MERRSFTEVIVFLEDDKLLAFYSVGLITTYLCLFLGSFSPTHCRVSIAIVGVVCILLSVGAGYGCGILAGLTQNDASEALPILMLGIGVDDMFIICNSLD